MFCPFTTVSLCVSKASPEYKILLPQPLEDWDMAHDATYHFFIGELGRYTTLSPSYLGWVICVTLLWLIQRPSVRSASLIPLNGFHHRVLISVSSLHYWGSLHFPSQLYCRSCKPHNPQPACGIFNPTCSSAYDVLPTGWHHRSTQALYIF